jgi:hypothetical protein
MIEALGTPRAGASAPAAGSGTEVAMRRHSGWERHGRRPGAAVVGGVEDAIMQTMVWGGRSPGRPDSGGPFRAAGSGDPSGGKSGPRVKTQLTPPCVCSGVRALCIKVWGLA